MLDMELWGENNAIALDLQRKTDVPAFRSAKGEDDGLYYCGNGTFGYSFRSAAEEDITGYLAELEKAGFEKYTANMIDQSRFYTYRNGKNNVYISWYARVGIAKVAVAPAEFLPPLEDAGFEKIADPTLTQIGRHGAYESLAPGMSYVMQLSDGRYIVMDGGPRNEWDKANLLRFLKLYKPEQHEKPVIAMWILSHADGDHSVLPIDFMRAYKDEFQLEMIAHGLPDFASIRMPKIEPHRPNQLWAAENFVAAAKEVNPDVVEWKFHTGQKLRVADAEMEVLYTSEDHFPMPFNFGNNASSAWRFTVNGKVITFLGDCEKKLCQHMADSYRDALKSDILQLSHHGFNCATLDCYTYINPDTCLWAVDELRFRGYAWKDPTKVDKRTLGTDVSEHGHYNYLFNRYLRDESIRARCHYNSTVTAIIPLD